MIYTDQSLLNKALVDDSGTMSAGKWVGHCEIGKAFIHIYSNCGWYQHTVLFCGKLKLLEEIRSISIKRPHNQRTLLYIDRYYRVAMITSVSCQQIKGLFDRMGIRGNWVLSC